MGTNYYLCNSSYKEVEKYSRPPNTVETLTLSNGLRVHSLHVCKKSVGWKPLFEPHLGIYQSVKELLSFVKTNNRDWFLANEYGDTIPPEHFKLLLESWKEPDDKSHKESWGGYGYWFLDPEEYEFIDSEFV